MKNQTNPFTIKPVAPSKLIGRTKEINFIFKSIIESKHVSLIGESQTGKTSLLKYFIHPDNKKLFPDNYRMIFMNLEDIESLRSFWNELYQRIGEQVDIKNTSIEKVNSYADFHSYMQLLDEQKLKIVLIIDDFYRVEGFKDYNSYNPIFFSQLRALSSNYERLVYLFSTRSGIKVLETPGPGASLFFNIFINCTLKPFSRSDAEKLIQSYCEAEIADRLINEIDYLYEQTGFYPVFLQKLCLRWYDAFIEGDSDNKKRIKDAYSSDCKDNNKTYWDDCTNDEKQALMYLSENIDKNFLKLAPPFENFKPSFNQLESRCFIIRDDRSYRFFSPLFREYCSEEKKKQDDQKNQFGNKIGKWLLVISIVCIAILYGMFIQKSMHQESIQKNVQLAMIKADEFKKDDPNRYLYLMEIIKMDAYYPESIKGLQKIAKIQFQTGFSNFLINETADHFFGYFESSRRIYQKRIEKKEIDLSKISMSEFDKQVKFSPNTKSENRLIAASQDNQLLAYTEKGSLIIFGLQQSKKIYNKPFLNVTYLGFSPSATKLIITDNTKKLYVLTINNEAFKLNAHPVGIPIDSVEIYGDQKVVFSSISSSATFSNIYSYDINKKDLRTIATFQNEVTDLACLPSSQMIACGHLNGQITLLKSFDKSDTRTEQRIGHQKDRIIGLSFSTDHQWLVSSSMDKTICLWNMNDLTRPIMLSDENENKRPAHYVHALNNFVVSVEMVKPSENKAQICFWPISKTTLLKYSCQYLKGTYKNQDTFLSKTEWERTFTNRPYQKTCSE